MEASYICAHCKNEGAGEMKMVPGCNHYFCLDCSEKPELKLMKGQFCPAIGNVVKTKCGQKINDLVSIFVPTGVEGILDQIQNQIGEMKNEKELLKNVRDGVVSFTRNLINASSQLIERNVRFLQSDQQEKSEILKQGTDFSNKAVARIGDLVSRAERMKKGQIQKTQQNMAGLQKSILEVSAVTGAFESKLTFIGNQIYDSRKSKLFVSEPNEYGTFAGAVHKDDNPGLLSKDFFPPTYLPSDYFSTHLIPPYMEYVFVIPNFFNSAKYDTPVISPVFHTLPFPFKWRFLVYPRGTKASNQNQGMVSAYIELVNGNELSVANKFRNFFPEYNQSENFPHFTFNPSTSPQSSSSSSSSASSSSSSSSSSTSPSAPFDPSTLSAESIAALMRNPFVFDYKIQIVAQKPSAKAEQRVYTHESTANFERIDTTTQGKSDFVSKKVVESGFVWGEDQKFKNSVHFVFGIRFPSFKREYEALRVAFELPDEYKKDGK